MVKGVAQVETTTTPMEAASFQEVQTKTLGNPFRILVATLVVPIRSRWATTRMQEHTTQTQIFQDFRLIRARKVLKVPSSTMQLDTDRISGHAKWILASRILLQLTQLQE